MVQEGYNLPDCECVIVLRPTLSLSMWCQMCGRGSRLTPNKRVLTLIDLTDNHVRLGDPMMEFDWSLEPRLSKEEEGLYSILDIATVRDMRLIANVLVARLDYDRVVIEQDRHDKPLAEALEARGVPPSQIVLAYQGEAV